MSGNYYVDSSVILRAIIENSIAAQEWFESKRDDRFKFIGSRLVDIEVRRNTKNARIDVSVADSYLNKFDFIDIDDGIVDKAIALDVQIGGADSLHIATALRLGTDTVTLVTHDAQMANAAKALGFTVIDPVTDDPRRPPVA